MSATRPSLLSVTLVSAAIVVAASGGAVAGTVITGAQIKDGTVTSADVKNGSLSKGDLTAGTVRALQDVRGWASVQADGSVVRASSGLKVSKPGAVDGTYCLTVPGVDARTTAPVAGLVYTSSGTALGVNQPQAFVEVGANDGVCATTQVQVNTMLRTYTGGSTTLARSDQAFYVIVP